MVKFLTMFIKTNCFITYTETFYTVIDKIFNREVHEVQRISSCNFQRKRKWDSWSEKKTYDLTTNILGQIHSGKITRKLSFCCAEQKFKCKPRQLWHKTVFSCQSLCCSGQYTISNISKLRLYFVNLFLLDFG